MAVLDRLYSHYDNKYAGSDFKHVRPVVLRKRPTDRIEAAVRLASENSGGKYLEIGAGDGSSILALIDRYERLVVTEFSEIRVRQLELLLKNEPRVTVIRNDVERSGIPFNSNEFDTIALIAVIEHLVDPISVLRECNRVLKPGGRLILDTPNIAKWTRRLKLLLGYFPSTASFDEGLLCYDRVSPTDLHDEGHLHYFTCRSLRRLALERAGFDRVEIFGYGKTPLHRLWPQMFSEISMVLYK